MRATATAVSVALHVAVIGALLWLTRPHTPPKVEIAEQPIHLPQRKGDAKPTGEPGPPPRHRPERRPRPELPVPLVEIAPQIEDARTDGPRPDVAGPAGPIGNVGNPYGSPEVVGGPSDLAFRGPQPFDDARMTPPRLLSGPNPRYTEQALEHEIEGVMAVRCVVTVEGRVRNCRIVKGLPFLDAEVIRSLEQRRYAPATIGGRPVEVDYRFQVQMKLP